MTPSLIPAVFSLFCSFSIFLSISAGAHAFSAQRAVGTSSARGSQSTAVAVTTRWSDRKPLAFTDDDVLNLKASGLPDAELIAALERDHNTFDVSSVAIAKLRKAAVSPQVVAALLSAASFSKELSAVREARESARLAEGEHRKRAIIDYGRSSFLGNEDVLSMHQNGASDDAIVKALYSHISTVRTDSLSILDDLSRRGLSHRVIRAMLSQSSVSYVLANPPGGPPPLLETSDHGFSITHRVGPGSVTVTDLEVTCADVRTLSRVEKTLTIRLRGDKIYRLQALNGNGATDLEAYLTRLCR